MGTNYFVAGFSKFKLNLFDVDSDGDEETYSEEDNTSFAKTVLLAQLNAGIIDDGSESDGPAELARREEEDRKGRIRREEIQGKVMREDRKGRQPSTCR